MVDIDDERLARLRIRIKSYGEKLDGNESYEELKFILKNSDIIKKEKEKTSNLISSDPKYKNKEIKKSEVKNHINIKFPRDREPIYLISHKSKRIESRKECYDCGIIYSTLWRYRQSNHGEIYLCNICKQNALERSFLYVDALSMAYNRKIK